MLVGGIGQLVMLFLGDQAVLDDLAIGAVLVELVGGIAQIRRLPEGRARTPAFLDDAILVNQLDEEDVPRTDRHEDEDGERDPRDDTAFLKGRDETEIGSRVTPRRCICCWCCHLINSFSLSNAVNAVLGETQSDGSRQVTLPESLPEDGFPLLSRAGV